ncbi:MAG: hypothetical protein V3T05_05835 [Myxococcota bacterium]
MAAPGVGNAVEAGLEASSGGVLARTLAGGLHPMIELAAFGECVGLEPGAAGNSEAGHNNMCAGTIVPQRRVQISRTLANADASAAPHLFAVMHRSATTGRPLHVIAYLGDRSSVGHHEHLHSLLKLAKREGVGDVQVHGICRGTGRRSCRELADEARQVMKREGIGRFSSIAGRKFCINREGVTDGTRACMQGFEAERTGAERSLDTIFDQAGDGEGEARLKPEPVKGGLSLTDADDVVLMLYRRDSAVGLTRVLRRRQGETAPPSSGGPRVATFGLLDAQNRYDDDPRLADAFVFPVTDGMLHRRLAAAGVRQLRIAEQKKAAHVTYFCDGGDVPDGPSYARVHPESLSEEEGRAQPCLRAEASVAAAVEAMQRGSADFIMINLPSADLMGHTGDFEAARKGVACLDRVLTDFVARAAAAGYPVLITADHGNAEEMLVDGKVDRNHSANPVPFIAIAARGKPPYELRASDTLPCLGDVAWTVLDILGLPTDRERSLLTHRLR